MIRKTASAVLAALTVLALGAAAASAGQSQYATVFKKFEFQAGSGSKEFSGKIDSNKSRCFQDRKVVVYLKKDGDKQKLGGDETNNKGKFEIGVGGSLKNGKYFAEAKKSSFENGKGDKITCGGADSAKVTLS